MVALPGTQEQIVYNPLIYQNAFIVNTTVPAINSPSSCTINHDTGNTIAISLATIGLLQKLLFGLTPHDPLTMLSSVAILAAVALAASYLPARRAMRTDPMQALRYE